MSQSQIKESDCHPRKILVLKQTFVHYVYEVITGAGTRNYFKEMNLETYYGSCT